MAESVVDICNRALSTAGVTNLIEKLDQAGSVEAEQCRLWYARLRDQILRERHWPFAGRRAILALVAGETRSDWAFVYALPGNCLAVRRLVSPGARDPWVGQGYPYRYFQGATPTPSGAAAANVRVPHAIEARVDGAGAVIGKLLLTDLESAELIYTVRVENPQVFDADFEAALELRLASRLALALPNDPVLSRDLFKQYEETCHEAGATAANEEQQDPEGVSSFEAARR